MKKYLVLSLALLTGACATAGTPAAPAGVPPGGRVIVPSPAPRTGLSLIEDGMIPPAALHWTRTSAEHRAILLQSYDLASAKLRELTSGLERGTWAVIMDADETVLDNTLYFQRQAELGFLDFSFQSWIDFVHLALATALPGAVEYTELVRELGGRVVIVTNRAEYLCDSTKKNLDRARIVNDAVLCRPPDSEDKNPRFRAVEEGTVEGLPALQVVMYVGDNVQDFPDVTQASLLEASDRGYAEFGDTWWILPNPIYGSWQRNPLPPDTETRH